MNTLPDTIVALATPPGWGGIGIARLSGSQVPSISHNLLGHLPKPRYATFSLFKDAKGVLIDQGITLYFPAPHSFTGEEVLELHGHGGPVVMEQLIQATLQLGARLARPGEFSERAFLNGKMDLAQAEAIADLIGSASVQAAQCALRSLQGEFSAHVHELAEQLMALRSYVEASIDFVEEEIELLAAGQVVTRLNTLMAHVMTLLDKAHQGYLLKEGMRIVLVGEPNVGKSSLLNCLSGRDTAIVTAIPGTTRDTIHEHMQLEGMPLHITDTAGLRETTDPIEQEGIRRTRLAIEAADLVILLLDDHHPTETLPTHLFAEMPTQLLIIRNKIDLTGHAAGLNAAGILFLSAKTGAGIAALKQYLKKKMGLQPVGEGSFIARRRHLEALQQTQAALERSLENAKTYCNTELVAEELRQAQQALGEITGTVITDDLLARIFSTFCIGK